MSTAAASSSRVAFTVEFPERIAARSYRSSLVAEFRSRQPMALAGRSPVSSPPSRQRTARADRGICVDGSSWRVPPLRSWSANGIEYRQPTVTPRLFATLLPLGAVLDAAIVTPALVASSQQFPLKSRWGFPLAYPAPQCPRMGWSGRAPDPAQQKHRHLCAND